MRIGIVSLAGRGHAYPLGALGLSLINRGHTVTLFGSPLLRSIWAKLCLTFAPLKSSCRSVSSCYGSYSLAAILQHAELVLSSAEEAYAHSKLDALLIDQGDLASGTVAEKLGIPFISLATFPPLVLCSNLPPFTCSWPASNRSSHFSLNERANRDFIEAIRPTFSVINQYRSANQMAPLLSMKDCFSKIALISQMPYSLEFPGLELPDVRYSGPWALSRSEDHISFPWHRLNGKPIVFVSFGTVQYNQPHLLKLIAVACCTLKVQLVVSLGGMNVTPDDLVLLGDPIVVHFCPQLAILRRASVMVAHGGLNTTLEALHSGIPLLTIPMSDDQFGVASRLKSRGLSIVLRARCVTVDKLRRALERLLDCESDISAHVKRFASVNRLDLGLHTASEMIDSILKDHLSL